MKKYLSALAAIILTLTLAKHTRAEVTAGDGTPLTCVGPQSHLDEIVDAIASGELQCTEDLETIPDPGPPDVLPIPPETNAVPSDVRCVDLFGGEVPKLNDINYSQLCEWHADAAADAYVELENGDQRISNTYGHYIACINHRAAQEQKARCNINTDFRDGPNGALWKPVSDNTGNPVILYPASYTGGPAAPSSVEILDSAFNPVTTSTFRTVANGNRLHWNVNDRCEALPANLIVRATRADGITECRTVPDPCTRED